MLDARHACNADGLKCLTKGSSRPTCTCLGFGPEQVERLRAVDLDHLALPDVIAGRIRGAFGSTYLTLMSVMQGVALATLAARVAETSATFDVGDWVLTLNTFVVFVVVWNEYLVAALAFAWIPTFLDSLLPFSLLAAELFLELAPPEATSRGDEHRNPLLPQSHTEAHPKRACAMLIRATAD